LARNTKGCLTLPEEAALINDLNRIIRVEFFTNYPRTMLRSLMHPNVRASEWPIGATDRDHQLLQRASSLSCTARQPAIRPGKGSPTLQPVPV